MNSSRLATFMLIALLVVVPVLTIIQPAVAAGGEKNEVIALNHIGFYDVNGQTIVRIFPAKDYPTCPGSITTPSGQGRLTFCW